MPRDVTNLKRKLIKMLAGNAQRERERERKRERENLHKINMQHFAVSAAGRHVSVWHVLHMQMCSPSVRSNKRAAAAVQNIPYLPLLLLQLSASPSPTLLQFIIIP